MDITEGQGVRSVIRSLRIVELVGELQPARLSELARRLDEPKSSVQRLLLTLEQAGWVARSTGTEPGWVLTQRVARLAGRSGGDLGLRNAALPVMERLRRQTNETVHLALAEPPSMLLIERLESTHAVRYVEELGGLAPMALTSTGRASLSAMPGEFIESVLDQEQLIDGKEQRDRILTLIRGAAAHGYATTSDWRDGVFATAAPVLWEGGPMAPPALSISAPLSRMDEATQKLHASLVTQAAREIARQL